MSFIFGLRVHLCFSEAEVTANRIRHGLYKRLPWQQCTDKAKRIIVTAKNRHHCFGQLTFSCFFKCIENYQTLFPFKKISICNCFMQKKTPPKTCLSKSSFYICVQYVCAGLYTLVFVVCMCCDSLTVLPRVLSPWINQAVRMLHLP